MTSLFLICLVYILLCPGAYHTAGELSKTNIENSNDDSKPNDEEVIETDWSNWTTIKEYNSSGTGEKQERTIKYTVPQEEGWEVMTETKSEESIIPRTIKITRAPATEEKPTKKPQKDDDDDDDDDDKDKDKDKRGYETIRDFQREIRIGRKRKGKKVGTEQSIMLPKEVYISTDPFTDDE
ncbi:hypothetical protein EWB00_009837 [Schistosoma japonicum]|uniref:Uncharacterized protein n=1 Tax=Schistosoma japonicum TaxID=6182 RepID=A0A4Z2DRN9_SCHJA|nr:hypothetical protein KSF78_0005074 [Schistosoma japonicum]TNN18830.1 hypothetical protein EWB00_009837 [Schistosoma japonicum]